MVLSPEGGNNVAPFWYARVLGVFHAKVRTSHPKARSTQVERMPFLWVRWFGSEPDYQYGFQHARLPRIGFMQSGNAGAFGFLDPTLVLRGCHLIPAFRFGRTTNFLPAGHSAARRLCQEESDDWESYYVNMYVNFLNGSPFQIVYCLSFVDRDMVMRHFGGGIGHGKTALNTGQDDKEIEDDSDHEEDIPGGESDESEQSSEESDAEDDSDVGDDWEM